MLPPAFSAQTLFQSLHSRNFKCSAKNRGAFDFHNMMMPGSKGQKAVHACMIRLLNLGPAKHEVQNIQWMFVLHRPKRSVDSSDLRSKSADFELSLIHISSGRPPGEDRSRLCKSEYPHDIFPPPYATHRGALPDAAPDDPDSFHPVSYTHLLGDEAGLSPVIHQLCEIGILICLIHIGNGHVCEILIQHQNTGSGGGSQLIILKSISA